MFCQFGAQPHDARLHGLSFTDCYRNRLWLGAQDLRTPVEQGRNPDILANGYKDLG
jgi:hypothetical protein